MWLIKLFTRDKNCFQKHEQSVLNAVEGSLPDVDAIAIWRKRINSIQKVYRLSLDREVNLYNTRKGGNRIDDDGTVFPNTKEELKLAKVKIHFADGVKQTNAEIWVVRGLLFSICFDKSPEKWKDTPIESMHCELLADPMKIPEPTKLARTPDLTPILDQLREIGELVDIVLPVTLADSEKNDFYQIKSMPKDYLEMLKESDGFVINGWTILGHRIQKIMIDEEDFYMLAEKHGIGALCTTSKYDEMVLLEYEDDVENRLEESFLESLLHVAIVHRIYLSALLSLTILN